MHSHNPPPIPAALSYSPYFHFSSVIFPASYIGPGVTFDAGEIKLIDRGPPVISEHGRMVPNVNNITPCKYPKAGKYLEQLSARLQVLLEYTLLVTCLMCRKHKDLLDFADPSYPINFDSGFILPSKGCPITEGVLTSMNNGLLIFYSVNSSETYAMQSEACSIASNLSPMNHPHESDNGFVW